MTQYGVNQKGIKLAQSRRQGQKQQMLKRVFDFASLAWIFNLTELPERFGHIDSPRIRQIQPG